MGAEKELTNQVLVDIPMCTYNHAQHIGAAIEGVMMQKTNFRYRLTVGEDCSTDDTRKIVKSYLAKYPDRMRAFFHKENIGAHANSKILFESCTARYIALCDGDDYWTDEHKLQKQVDFLEANPGYASCFHNTTELVEENPSKSFLYCSFNQPDYVTTDKLLSQGNLIPTCSDVYRRELVPDLPAWVRKLPMGDWPINILLSQKGKIRYINEVMGVHRINTTSIWSILPALRNDQQMLDAYKSFHKNLILNSAQQKIISGKIREYVSRIRKIYQKRGDNGKAFIFLAKELVTSPVHYLDLQIGKRLKKAIR